MAASLRIMAEGFFLSYSPHSSNRSPSFLFIVTSLSHLPTSGSTLGVTSSSSVSVISMGLANMPAGRYSSLEMILFLGTAYWPEFLCLPALGKFLPLEARHSWSILKDFLSF